jgi:catechol 2,3-dioxygenase-like lactoylglutathione lyase family enzyme
MAVVGIDTLVFTAPDMAKARRFYTDWGLKKVRDGRAGMSFATEIGSEVIVRPEDAQGLPPPAAPGMHFREMIWGVSSAMHLAEIRAELEKDRNVTVDKDGTLHCIDPNGLGLGFRVWRHGKRLAVQRTPVNITGAYERIDRRSNFYERARPLRMGHIGFVVPDLKAADRFYNKRLGFPISDRYAKGAATFMRCSADNEHHNLFLIRSRDGTTRFDHVAFEVRDIHEVFAGGLHIDRKGWPTEVGPGRHPISSAYFWYFKSPTEGAVEYYADSDYLTAAWKPTSFRVNRFSEWHLVDGIRSASDRQVRPAIAATYDSPIGPSRAGKRW